jgi:hypothetical protein
MKIFKRMLLIAVMCATSISSWAIPALGDAGVTRVEATRVAVPQALRWSQPAVKAASNLLDEAQSGLELVLDDFRSDGASYLVISNQPQRLFSATYFEAYPEYAEYENAWNIEGFTAWGASAGGRDSSLDESASLSAKLVGFADGGCRLQFDLWNWNTWFAPDCSVVVADPKSLLRAELIQAIGELKPFPGEYFDVAETLGMISSVQAPYSVADGEIVCPYLRDIEYRNTPLPLSQPFYHSKAGEPVNQSGFELTGYNIEVDPADKWNFTLNLLGKTPQELASSVIVGEGNKFEFQF